MPGSPELRSRFQSILPSANFGSNFETFEVSFIPFKTCNLCSLWICVNDSSRKIASRKNAVFSVFNFEPTVTKLEKVSDVKGFLITPPLRPVALPGSLSSLPPSSKLN